jgi:iron complex transport system substrate-binding protein
MNYILAFVTGCLTACQPSKIPFETPSKTQSVSNHYAKLYRLSYDKSDTFLHVLDENQKPVISYFWGKSSSFPDHHKIHAKGKKIVLSVLFARILKELDISSEIVGVDNLAYFPADIPVANSCISLQKSGIVDYETLLKLPARLTFAYFLQTNDFQQLNRLNSANHTVVFIQSHQEEHPLARAEWIRPMAWLLGKPKQGDSIFNLIKQHYELLTLASKKLPQPKKRVMLNLPFQGSWYVPNGRNYFTRLLFDAGLEPAWEFSPQQSSKESILISLEQAVGYLQHCDYWLNLGSATNKSDVSNSEPRLSSFCRNPRIKLFQCDLKMEAQGANPFWDLGFVHPELLLSDLIEIQKGTSTLNFYRRL